MNLCILKLAFILFPFVFVTGNNTWKVQSSEITFAVKYIGSTVTGSFSGLVADIKFDPMKPEEAFIKASVEAKTIETGINLRNKDLRNNFFEAETYPLITLQSIKIEKTGPINYVGTFNLTMKNITKQVTLPFLFMKTADKTEFKGSVSLNRLDYGVGRTRTGMADNVDVYISVIVSENIISAKE